ncbi:hypothetical protein BU17DRAFT_64356 [Hysterangium stoloniferum]|nr:hypothetical protein BU17DRAFT_64356 [Hysterangium stoloniferum]
MNVVKAWGAQRGTPYIRNLNPHTTSRLSYRLKTEIAPIKEKSKAKHEFIAAEISGPHQSQSTFLVVERTPEETSFSGAVVPSNVNVVAERLQVGAMCSLKANYDIRMIEEERLQRLLHGMTHRNREETLINELALFSEKMETFLVAEMND